MKPHRGLLVIGSAGLWLAWPAFGACPEARFAAPVVADAGGAAFDEDGHLDLAVTNFLSGGGPNHVAILLGDGTGAFGAPTRFEVGRGATRIAAADFNGDGDADVAVVQDSIAPSIESIVTRPETLPSEHGLVPVSITAVASDVCDPAPTCRIVSVVDSLRSRRVDAALVDPGPKPSPADLHVLLRAAGPARIYTINVSCADASGHAVTDRRFVTVTSPPGSPGRPPRVRPPSSSKGALP